MVSQSQMVEANIQKLDEQEVTRKMICEETKSTVEEIKRENENLLYLYREKESEYETILKSISEYECEVANNERERDNVKNECNKVNA